MADGLGRSGLGGCLDATVSRKAAVDVPAAETLGAAGMQEHPDRPDYTDTQERLSISSKTCSVPPLLSQVLHHHLKLNQG